MIKVKIDEIKPGDKLARTLYYQYGAPILTAGTTLNQKWIDKLRVFGYQSVYIYDKDLEDVVVYDYVDPAVQRRLAKRATKLFENLKEETRGVFEPAMLKTSSTDELRAKLASPEMQKAVSRLKIGDQFLSDVETIVAGLLSDQEVCLSIGVMKTLNSYVFDHSLEVTIRSLLIARKVGFTSRELYSLALGCLLHDIGYVLTPEDILLKRTKRTAAEENVLKQHSLVGYYLLKNEREVGILPAHVAYQHHERVDGGGYPRGLVGSNRLENHSLDDTPGEKVGHIHRFAAVAAVADFYDTLVSDGPLGRGVAPDTAVKILRELAGTHFNQTAVDAFLGIIPVFPVGTMVMFTDGDLKGFKGVVISVSRGDLDLPTVRCTMAGKKRLEKTFDVDLRQTPMHIKTVSR
ncbi:MAG: HD domain-containing protein [Planctomycetota bacterium]|nr:HD domain-containing protein [Planctomycetota bacterium]